MAEPPQGDSIEDIQRQADDFARRQYEDVFKRFEQLLKPSFQGRDDDPDSPAEDSERAP
jgi:hypothetical protein